MGYQHKAVVFALALVASCAPSSPDTKPTKAQAAAIDLGVCAANLVLLPSLGALGRELEARTDWKTWGLSQLSSALGASAACGLHALATSLKADGPPPNDVLRQRAAKCGPDGSGCTTAEDRAAWLLWRLSAQPWPKSGEG